MKQKLIEWANKYEVASFIANDPVQFPRKHIGKRAEISGFITSWLSFGNRKAIIKAADWLDKDFCDDPYCSTTSTTTTTGSFTVSCPTMIYTGWATAYTGCMRILSLWRIW